MNTRPKAVRWSALPESQRRRVISRLSQLALRQLSVAGAMEGRNDERHSGSTAGAERESPG
jgi:predicted Fe-S protein YdhL (DUF1289 family)